MMSKDTSKLEEILRRATDIWADGSGGLARGNDFIDINQAKADLLAWHREECLKIIGEDEKGHIDIAPQQSFADYSDEHYELSVRNELRAELRASLEVE